MPHPLRSIAVLIASSVMVALPPPSLASTAMPHDVTKPTLASGAVSPLCSPPAPDPVPDDQPIVVLVPPGPSFTVGQIPSSWWKTPPYGDSGWQLQVRGFIWVGPIAQRAYDDGQTRSLASIVDQVLAFHAQSPDRNTNDAGWDEGSALRRLQTEDCLYALTKDPRLIPAMSSDVAVQFSWRFYGPPNHAVHNHGVMADLGVIRASRLLGRTDWEDRSIARLVAEAPKVWTPEGTTHEQSASYHAFNVGLWRQVSTALAAARGDSDPGVQKVRALDAKAAAVSSWLTEPDGKMTLMGDSSADPGFPQPTWTQRVFRDDVAGLAVGRWSWRDPNSTYYVIRYGPRRWGHGQQERAGVTWTTSGVRVLVNPGKAPYDPAGNYRSWAGWPSAHNVVVVDRRPFVDTPVFLTSTTQATSWHTWVLTDVLYGVRHTRQVTVVRDTHSLVVRDRVPARTTFRQFWHLDPSWQLVSRSADGKRLVLRSGKHTLAVTTTGNAITVRGSTRPVAGWHFPGGGVRKTAVEIQVRAASSVQTTFKVVG